MGRRHSEYTKQLIRVRWERRRYGKMNRILDLVRTQNPCHLTNRQIADHLGVTPQQVCSYLKRMVASGILRKEVKHFNFGGFLRCTRRLWEPDAVPEGQVRSEGDAEQGS